MMNIIVRPIVYAVVLLQAISISRADAPKKRAGLEEIIFSRDAFVSQLPEVTLIVPNTMKVSEEAQSTSLAEVEKALDKLGPTPGHEFQLFPKAAKPAEVKQPVKPEYPRDQRNSHSNGRADFLVLIGEDGNVVALYCYSVTEKPFGVSGAASLARWTFKPAEIKGTKVPVLTRVVIVFEYRDGS